MTTTTIRQLFSTTRPIDRPIEKVIDYYASDDTRLAREIDEYEVTSNIERCFERFLEVYDSGVRGGQVTEIGMWVSGFYGSGKSSFTKYLGFALDTARKVKGRTFLDLLYDRLPSTAVKAQLRAVAQRAPTAVVMLDLGTDQLVESAAAPVANVLYYKVLQLAGYSRDRKLAELELKLEAKGLYYRFQDLYKARFSGEWKAIHNDALSGPARAAQIVPELLPQDFPTPDSFRQLRVLEALDLREQTRRMIAIVRRAAKCENILFLIDEAGQYVAPRAELILNLDGFARAVKEEGKGRVWVVCTGQQTLTEIVERAAINSAELNKLRDRFPIPIDLEARDIREITYRRLLTKSPDGERTLRKLFAQNGQALVTHTRLAGTKLYSGDPDADTFVHLYPFLPQHFDLLLELIRSLARATGGIGLRSAIRVIQDLLVDASKVLPSGTPRLAEQEAGSLACADQFFDTLRADIGKVLPHVVQGVDRIAKVYAGDPLAVRVAKAIAALQAVEGFPRTAENLAALLYPRLGAPSLADEVRETLHKLLTERECGIIDDPKSGGFQFVSDGVRSIREKRNAYSPTGVEITQTRAALLKDVFEPAPSVRLESVKEVKAGVRLDRASIVEADAEIQILLQSIELTSWDERRTSLLGESLSRPDLANRIMWMIPFPEELEDGLAEICRSEWLLHTTSERDADRDVAQYLRAERNLAQRNRERAAKLLQEALQRGTLIFRGRPFNAAEIGSTVLEAAKTVLKVAAESIYGQLHLVPIRPATDLAASFLCVDRLDRVPRELDPLKLVEVQGGRARINLQHPALVEAQRAFADRARDSGAGRLQGSAIHDLFAAAPYGWSKDATRYLFAALLKAGEIELHTAEGVLKAAGPKAQECFRSTVTFNRVGVSLRDVKVSHEELERAATRLEEMFGSEVMPLEDRIAAAVRANVPQLVERLGALPDRLRLLGLPGEARSRGLLQAVTDLLQQDGAAATALLGAKGCSIPADVTWAKGVAKALDNGAEDEVRAAGTLLAGLKDLTGLWPQIADQLAAKDAVESATEVLASESFADRMPTLRAAVRHLQDAARAALADVRRDSGAQIEKARAHLQSRPEWLRLAPEDQAEILGHLADSPTGMPEGGQELAELRHDLVRRDQLPGLAARLEGEVQRRVPPLPEPLELPPDGDLAVVVLEIPAEPLTAEALQGWLDELRKLLEPHLRPGKRVRLTRG